MEVLLAGGSTNAGKQQSCAKDYNHFTSSGYMKNEQILMSRHEASNRPILTYETITYKVTEKGHRHTGT